VKLRKGTIMKSTEEKLIEILDGMAIYNPVEVTVTKSTRFEADLGMDSMDGVEMVMCIEDVFGLVIPDPDVIEVSTVGAMVDYIDKRLELVE